MANTINLSHEKTSTGARIQHIQVNGIELSGRRIPKSEDTQLYDDLIVFLNDKAQDAIKRDPNFYWLNLAEFRSWAKTYTKEFLKSSQEKQEQDILNSVKNNKQFKE